MELNFKLNNIEFTINDNVFHRLNVFKQHSSEIPESGGLLIGRTDIKGKTKIFEITEPMNDDLRNRFTFKRKDKMHLQMLTEAKERCLYFKGSWHTHPQKSPTPSWIDKIAWKSAMIKSKPGESQFIFFVIVGTEEIKVWCGNMKTHSIQELEFQR